MSRQYPRCGKCNRTHTSRMSLAVGRFSPRTPTTYRADFNGSTVRATRAEADADQCKAWAAQ